MKQSRNQVSISIVIPAYNEARALRRCLEGISRQTVAPAEVIVVDNNSIDTTRKVAESFAFVRVVAESRQGIVNARNAGFDAVRSEIIARIDADTLLPKNWIETIQEFYTSPEHRETVFTGGCYFYNLRTGRLTGRLYDFIVHHINRVLAGHYFPWGSNCAIPASAWRRIREDVCLRTDIHEDLDIGLHLRDAGYSMVYDSKIRVGAQARRLVSEHGKLWGYVMMWPYTLSEHRIQTWPVAWLVALSVWLGSYSIIIAEFLMRRIKKRVYEASLET